MSDLTEFLLAHIADDEAAARVHVLVDPLDCPVCGERVEEYITPATIRGWKPDRPDRVEPCGHELTPELAESCFRYMIPARARAECEAKRRIVEDMRNHLDEDGGWGALCERQLRHLAAVYSDHPDYGEAWRA